MISRRSFITGLAGVAISAAPALAALPVLDKAFALPTRAPKDRGLIPQDLDPHRIRVAIENLFEEAIALDERREAPDWKNVAWHMQTTTYGLAYVGSLKDKRRLSRLYMQFYFDLRAIAEKSAGRVIVWRKVPTLVVEGNQVKLIARVGMA